MVNKEEQLQAKIKKLTEQEEKIKLKKRHELAKLNSERRKKRTKRLIEKGAIIENLQGANADMIFPEQTLDWLKNNITSKKEKELQAELNFFKNLATNWTITDKNQNTVTITEYIANQWEKTQNNVSK